MEGGWCGGLNQFVAYICQRHGSCEAALVPRGHISCAARSNPQLIQYVEPRLRGIPVSITETAKQFSCRGDLYSAQHGAIRSLYSVRHDVSYGVYCI